MASKSLRFETRLIHAGELRPRALGAVSTPIFQSSTFEYGGEGSYHDIRYLRLSNSPNHLVLHQRLAALEGAEAALVTASGMAAISTTLLSLLSTGDHLLVQDSLYGGTHDFIREDLPRLGISYTFIDADDPASWEAQVKPNTRAIYVETMTNPLLRMGDLEAVARFARERRLVSVIDNTFASPLLFRPPERGFDLSLHSCTKYLNGHTDLVAGAVIGRAALVEKVKHKLDHLGGSLDPHACFLLERGLFQTGSETGFDGEVVGLHRSGAFVAFGGSGSLPFEGMLPLRRLTGDWWELNEPQTMLVGSRSGRTIRLGDAVQVRVGRIEAPRGRVDLYPASDLDG